MASIEEMIKESTCFGLAYSSTVRECKICEVKLKCENKCRMGVGELPQKPAPTVLAEKDEVSTSSEAVKKSEKKEAAANEAAKVIKKKSTKTKKQSDVKYSDDMPEFKPMSIEEMETLLIERGGNPADFEKYTNPSIKKMRLTMALKKTYVVD